MTMKKIKFGKNFPWKTLLLGILVAILLVSLVGILIMGTSGFVAFVAGGTLFVGGLILGVLVACFTNMFFLGGLFIGLGVFFVYFYRKNYGKKTGYVPSPGVTGGVDTLSKPLFDEDMKVESA